MRKLIGCCVLLGGIGALGYVATTQAAPRMQSLIAANVQSVADTSPHSISTQVSGRDVRVSGLVTDQTELAVLEAAISGTRGVRVVDLSGIETLPLADPFALSMTRNDDGVMTASGVVPSEAARATLLAATGADAGDLTLAAGVPDADWADIAGAGAVALSALQSGSLRITNRDIALTGVALTPSDAAAATAPLADLPDGYVLTPQIETLDDGAPLRLSLGLMDSAVDAFGKFPANMQPSEVTDRFPVREDFEVVQSVLPSADPDWPDMVRTGMEALGGLIEADLTIENTDLRLAGVGSPDGIAQAQTLLAGLPDAYTVTTDLGVYGADFELRLGMEWDGNTASATGTYPADFTPRGPAGVAVSDVGQTLFLPDGDGAFTANANAGVAALGMLDTGTLIATANRIVLSGTAASPQVGVSMDSVLANAAPDTEIARNLTYLDDGSPAAWTLSYDAQTGADIEGRLPTGLTARDLADQLGVADISGRPATALEDDTIGSAPDALTLVAAYLPEIETLTFAAEDGGSALDLIMSPGVDLDLVAIDLAERLPVDVAFSLGSLEDLPARGATRTNAATGLNQIFTDGFWLPDLAFAADETTCADQTAAVLQRSSIGFLSSSARLDATSIRAINALSAVALVCVDAGLSLEVGGHTDATGSVLANDVLSQNRANAVRDALAARGVPAQAMTAFGFGQTQPIADNATAEGRAANRRTDITWFAPGALRDP